MQQHPAQEEPAQQQGEEPDQSIDELDLIGDGHESDADFAQTMAAGLEDFALNAGVDEEEYITLNDAFQRFFEAALGAQTSSEPRTLAEALAGPDGEQWFQAAIEEINALVSNGTWKPVPVPPGRKPIGCKWVFKIKRNADGSIERFKARLVAKGFSQRPGLDFEQTFAPTAKWAALRAILALAALEDLEADTFLLCSSMRSWSMM